MEIAGECRSGTRYPADLTFKTEEGENSGRQVLIMVQYRMVASQYLGAGK